MLSLEDRNKIHMLFNQVLSSAVHSVKANKAEKGVCISRVAVARKELNEYLDSLTERFKSSQVVVHLADENCKNYSKMEGKMMNLVNVNKRALNFSIKIDPSHNPLGQLDYVVLRRAADNVKLFESTIPAVNDRDVEDRVGKVLNNYLSILATHSNLSAVYKYYNGMDHHIFSSAPTWAESVVLAGEVVVGWEGMGLSQRYTGCNPRRDVAGEHLFNDATKRKYRVVTVPNPIPVEELMEPTNTRIPDYVPVLIQMPTPIPATDFISPNLYVQYAVGAHGVAIATQGPGRHVVVDIKDLRALAANLNRIAGNLDL